MLKVKVRFENQGGKTATKLLGYCRTKPELHKDFIIFIRRGQKVQVVDVGFVFNIKNYERFMLIQTDLAVVEVWFDDPAKENQTGAKILPFKKVESNKGFRPKLVYSNKRKLEEVLEF